jgi:hypothetical protein
VDDDRGAGQFITLTYKEWAMLATLKLLAQLLWARLRRDDLTALSILRRIAVLTFDAMDTEIQNVSAKVAADKSALDAANASLATAQADAANAQGQLDQRTAAIAAAIA